MPSHRSRKPHASVTSAPEEHAAGRLDPRFATARWLGAGLLLLAALHALAPHAVSDADALSRLATGRLLVERRLALPASDPFTFAAPHVPFGDPEWLGDLLLYATYRLVGPDGLQAFVVQLAVIGYGLALALGAQFGARAAPLAWLLASTLPAVAPRVAARNDVHVLWIVPAFAWLCARAPARPKLWLAVAVLGWLWANMHASFLLGLPLLAAALLDGARSGGESRSAAAAARPHDGARPQGPARPTSNGLGPALSAKASAAAAGRAADAGARREPAAAKGSEHATPRERAPARARGAEWIVFALYPALPWLGVSGSSTYRQLIDHARGAAIYRGLIAEWQSPLSSGGQLAILPLHLLALLGAYALWKQRRSPSWLRVTMIAGGCALAYASRRFLLLSGVMIVPAAAAALSGCGAQLSAAPRRALQAGAWLALAAFLALALRAQLRLPPPPVWGRPDTAERAAHFIAGHAAAGSRIANTFNDGPWLVWLCAPRVRHYLDPRNNLGADLLARYVHEIQPDPARFRAEADRLHIGLALMRARDPHSKPLAAQLAAASDWPLVYWDGHHALHARDQPENQPLIQDFGYRILKPSLDLAYLDRAADDPQLELELKRLEQQSIPLATVLRAYRLLRTGDPRLALRAAQAFASAIPDLPESPELFGYLEQSLRSAERAR